MTYHYPHGLMFPWQPCFDKHVFQISISFIKKIKKSFLFSIFKVLRSFCGVLFVLITFDPILNDFLRFWTNPEIQDGGQGWPPFKNDYAIITSGDVITS